MRSAPLKGKRNAVCARSDFDFRRSNPARWFSVDEDSCPRGTRAENEGCGFLLGFGDALPDGSCIRRIRSLLQVTLTDFDRSGQISSLFSALCDGEQYSRIGHEIVCLLQGGFRFLESALIEQSLSFRVSSSSPTAH